MKKLEIPNKSDEELKQLARDILNNLVFTDRHIPEHSKREISMIFMPLALGAFEDVSEADIKNIGMVYEYMDKAGPRAVNGFPNFLSFQIINKDDFTKVWDYYAKMKAAMDAI